MKICVYGAGAVGGHFAAQLAAAGHEVSAIARGDHLAALRANGITLLKGERRIEGKVRATDRPADIGAVDVVLATLKATALGALAAGIAPLLGPRTLVVFAQNGIPWWYAQGLSSERPKPPDLSALDPGGKLARLFVVERERLGWTAFLFAPLQVERLGATRPLEEPDAARRRPRLVWFRSVFQSAFGLHWGINADKTGLIQTALSPMKMKKPSP